MRYMTACGALLAALLIGVPVAANAAPYCASETTGGKNCGFYSMQQCQAALSGNGGFCARTSGPAR
jgi:hypothetical protein